MKNADVAEVEAANLEHRQKTCDHRAGGMTNLTFTTSAGVACYRCRKALSSEAGALAVKREFCDRLDEYYASPEFARMAEKLLNGRSL